MLPNGFRSERGSLKSVGFEIRRIRAADSVDPVNQSSACLGTHAFSNATDERISGARSRDEVVYSGERIRMRRPFMLFRRRCHKFRS